MPSIRARVAGGRIVVSADAEVVEIEAGSLSQALARVGALLGPETIATIPPDWCSWHCYFGRALRPSSPRPLDDWHAG